MDDSVVESTSSIQSDVTAPRDSQPSSGDKTSRDCALPADSREPGVEATGPGGQRSTSDNVQDVEAEEVTGPGGQRSTSDNVQEAEEATGPGGQRSMPLMKLPASETLQPDHISQPLLNTDGENIVAEGPVKRSTCQQNQESDIGDELTVGHEAVQKDKLCSVANAVLKNSEHTEHMGDLALNSCRNDTELKGPGFVREEITEPDESAEKQVTASQTADGEDTTFSCEDQQIAASPGRCGGQCSGVHTPAKHDLEKDRVRTSEGKELRSRPEEGPGRDGNMDFDTEEDVEMTDHVEPAMPTRGIVEGEIDIDGNLSVPSLSHRTSSKDSYRASSRGSARLNQPFVDLTNGDIERIVKNQPRVILKKLSLAGLTLPPSMSSNHDKTPVTIEPCDLDRRDAHPSSSKNVPPKKLALEKYFENPDCLIAGPGKVSCPACGVVFNEWRKLHAHVQNEHRDLPMPYRCSACDLGLFRLFNLRCHCAKQHPGEFTPQEVSAMTSPFPKSRDSDLSKKLPPSAPGLPNTASSKGKKRSSQLEIDVSLKKDAKRLKVESEDDAASVTSHASVSSVFGSPAGKLRFGCPLCKYTARRPNDMDVHFRVHHGNNRMPLQCKECGRGFFFQLSYDSHQRRYHGENSAPLKQESRASGKTETCAGIDILHCRIIENGVVKATSCTGEPRGTDSTHKRVKHPVKPIICHICKKQFKSEKAKLFHNKVKHRKNPKVKHSQLPKDSKLKRTKPSKGEVPSKKLKTQSLTKAPNKVSEFADLIASGTCPECKQHFPKKHYLDEHYRWEHRDLDMPQPCPICKLGFMCKSRRNHHLEHVHRIPKADLGDYDLDDTNPASPPSEDTSSSGLKGASRHSDDDTGRAGGETHLETNRGENKKGTVCKFSQKQLLRIQEKLRCPEGCKARFPHLGRLEQHYKHMHDAEVMPFHCQECDEGSFFAKYRMVKHYKSVHSMDVSASLTSEATSKPSEPGSHPTQSEHEQAGNVSTIKTPLSKKEISNAVSNLICPKCKGQFSRIDNLEKHFRKVHHHESDLPFQCELCDRAYFHKTSAVLHQKLTHKKLPSSCKTMANTRMKNIIKTSIKTLQYRPTCPACGKVFKIKKVLYRHYRKEHNSRKLPHQCEECRSGFFTEQDLKAHIKRNVHGQRLKVNSRNAETKPVQLTAELLPRVVVKLDRIVTDPPTERKDRSRIRTNVGALRKYKNVGTQCPICQNAYANTKILNTHFNTQHPKLQMPFQCEICQKGFFSLKGAKFHFTALHRNVNVPTPVSSQSSASTPQTPTSDKLSMDNAQCHSCCIPISVDSKHKDLGELQGIARIRFYCKNCKTQKSSLKDERTQAKRPRTPTKAPPSHLTKDSTRPRERKNPTYLEMSDDDSEFSSAGGPEMAPERPVRQQPKRQSLAKTVAEDKPRLKLPVCPECGKEYESVRGRDFHFRKDHSQIAMPYVCNICGLGYFSITNLNNHERKFHRASSVLAIQSSPERKPSQGQSKTKKQYVLCPGCQRCFSSSKGRDDHYRNIHSENNMPLHCHLCQRGYFTKDMLIAHYSHIHRIRKEETDRLLDGAPEFRETYTDEAPQKRPAESSKAAEHCEESEGFVFCSQCLQVFSSQVKRNEHVRKVHKKHFTCEVCGQGFKTPELLAVHISSTHVEEGHEALQPLGLISYKNGEDGADGGLDPTKSGGAEGTQDDKLGILSNQEKNHEGLKPLTCPECPARYMTKGARIKHIRSVHGNNVFPHKCPTCQKGYMEESSMKIHCKMCNKQGSQSGISNDNLSNHKWSHMFKGTDSSGGSQTVDDTTSSDASHDLSSAIAINKPATTFGGKVSIIQDSIIQTTLVQDSLIQDSFVRDSVIQDSVLQDTIVRDSVIRDMVMQDTIVEGVRGGESELLYIRDVNEVKTKPPYSCPGCDLSFSSNLSRVQHINNVHKDRVRDLMPFLCSLCSRGFFHQKPLVAHYAQCKQLHNLKTHVDVHQQKEKSTQALKDPMNGPTVIPVDSSQDESSQDGTRDPEVPRLTSGEPRVIHEETLKCPECDMKFSSEQGREMHYRAAHGSGKQTPYKCFKCGDQYFMLSAFKKHFAEMHQRIVPRGTMDSGTVSLAVPEPTQTVSQQQSVDVSMVTATRSEPGTIVLSSVPTQTVAIFTKSSSLDPAQSKAKAKDLIPTKDSTNKTKFGYPCFVCKRSFHRECNRLQHFKLKHATVPLPILCSCCSAGFLGMAGMDAHNARMKHAKWVPQPAPGGQNLQCLTCEEKLSSSTNYMAHVKSAHPLCIPKYKKLLELRYKLWNCGFREVDVVRLSMLPKDARTSVTCCCCNIRFVNEQNLETHVSNMHRQVPFIHRCQVCQAGFYLRSMLACHMMARHQQLLAPSVRTTVAQEPGMETFVKKLERVDRDFAAWHFVAYATVSNWNWLCCTVCGTIIFDDYYQAAIHVMETHNVRLPHFGVALMGIRQDKVTPSIAMVPVSTPYTSTAQQASCTIEYRPQAAPALKPTPPSTSRQKDRKTSPVTIIIDDDPSPDDVVLSDDELRMTSVATLISSTEKSRQRIDDLLTLAGQRSPPPQPLVVEPIPDFISLIDEPMETAEDSGTSHLAEDPGASHSATQSHRPISLDLRHFVSSQRSVTTVVHPTPSVTSAAQTSLSGQLVPASTIVHGLNNPIVIAPDVDFLYPEAGETDVAELCLVCGDEADRSSEVARKLPAACASCQDLVQTFNPILAPECPTRNCLLLPSSIHPNCDYCRFHKAVAVGLLRDGILFEYWRHPVTAPT